MARNTSFTFYREVNLNPRTGNTFYFADRGAQATYFNSKAITTVSSCYYQRANVNKVRVERPYSTLYKCDYLSFINPDYENKRFYAFVTGVTYIDDNTTEVTYIIDTLQTWFLDCTIPPCFIERMHTPTDDIGDYMIEETFDCGDYMLQEMEDDVTSNTLIVFVCTFNMIAWAQSGFTNKSAVIPVVNKNGIYDSIGQYAVYCSNNDNTQSAGVGSALDVILTNIYNGAGGVTMDDIVNVYIYPSIGLSLGLAETIGTQGGIFDDLWMVTGAYQGGQQTDLPDLPVDIDGYVPKNNKLFQYPFCCIHVTNNDGSAIDFKFERFREKLTNNIIQHPKAQITGTTTGEARLRLTPKQYMGSTTQQFDFENSIDSGAFPTVSMVGDPYLIYLAQNKNRIKNNYQQMLLRGADKFVGAQISDARTIIDTISSGGANAGSLNRNSETYEALHSTAIDSLSQIMSMNAQFKDLQIAPATSSGISGVGMAFQNGKRDFTKCVKTIDRYHAKCIDDFFTMFGYLVKSIDSVSVHNRVGFTYIKTVGCIVTGNVPETAKTEIETMFDNGIRFWVNPSQIGDYSISNIPIT